VHLATRENHIYHFIASFHIFATYISFPPSPLSLSLIFSYLFAHYPFQSDNSTLLCTTCTYDGSGCGSFLLHFPPSTPFSSPTTFFFSQPCPFLTAALFPSFFLPSSLLSSPTLTLFPLISLPPLLSSSLTSYLSPPFSFPRSLAFPTSLPVPTYFPLDKKNGGKLKNRENREWSFLACFQRRNIQCGKFRTFMRRIAWRNINSSRHDESKRLI